MKQLGSVKLKEISVNVQKYIINPSRSSITEDPDVSRDRYIPLKGWIVSWRGGKVCYQKPVARQGLGKIRGEFKATKGTSERVEFWLLFVTICFFNSDGMCMHICACVRRCGCVGIVYVMCIFMCACVSVYQDAA